MYVNNCKPVFTILRFTGFSSSICRDRPCLDTMDLLFPSLSANLKLLFVEAVGDTV